MSHVFKNLLVLLTTIFMLSACSWLNPFASDPPTDTVVDINIQADGNINPDYNGRASPVKLRIYQLKSAEVFNNADFFALEDKDKETLGGDLLKRTELTLSPDDMELLPNILLEKEACCIGFFVAYREVEEATWRMTVDTATFSYTKIDLNVGRLALSTNKTVTLQEDRD